MKWFVTGGLGFIGANLAEYLLSSGEEHQIVILDNLSASDPEQYRQVRGVRELVSSEPSANNWDFQRGVVRLVVGDIMDADLVRRASAGADAFIHLAANTGVAPSVANPQMDCRTNVFGTLNCLEAVRANNLKKFVFASSGAPAGHCEPPITENIVPRPASPYGASKLAGEAYCSAYANSFGVETVALRFSNVFGPYSWHKGSVVAKFIRQILAGEPITINGDGSQTRDFIYSRDLVKAVALAGQTQGIKGEIFQVSTGIETSVLELLDVLGPELERNGIAQPEIKFADRAPEDVLRNFADSSKARRQLNWRVETALKDGLRNTVDWFTNDSGLAKPGSAGRSKASRPESENVQVT